MAGDPHFLTEGEAMTPDEMKQVVERNKRLANNAVRALFRGEIARDEAVEIIDEAYNSNIDLAKHVPQELSAEASFLAAWLGDGYDESNVTDAELRAVLNDYSVATVVVACKHLKDANLHTLVQRIERITAARRRRGRAKGTATPRTSSHVRRHHRGAGGRISGNCE